MSISGAELVIRHLEAQKVTHVFGVPGAKIDGVYHALVGSSVCTVVCRHEQNASFMAQGIGRLTGRAGVCLVTSGPGTTNLVTGLPRPRRKERLSSTLAALCRGWTG